MKKWYRSCQWMFVAALAVQLTGCAQQRVWLSQGMAQQRVWLSSFPGPSTQSSTQVANVDGIPQPLDPAGFTPSNEQLVLEPEAAPAPERVASTQESTSRGLPIHEANLVPEVDVDELAELAQWEAQAESPRPKAEPKAKTPTPKEAPVAKVAPAVKATPVTKATVAKAQLAPVADPRADVGTKRITRNVEQVQRVVPARKVETAAVRPVEPEGKADVVDLLSLCPDAKGELREQIRSLNTSNVEVLKHRLGRLGNDPAAAPALEQLLKHKDTLVRMHAAFALARMQQSTPEGVRIVVNGLRSSDPHQRSFAAATIAEMGPQLGDALEAFAESLDSRDHDGNFRFEEAEVLIRVKPRGQTAAGTSVGKYRIPVKATESTGFTRIVEPVEFTEEEPEQAVESNESNVETIEIPAETLDLNTEAVESQEEMIELEGESEETIELEGEAELDPELEASLTEREVSVIRPRVQSAQLPESGRFSSSKKR